MENQMKYAALMDELSCINRAWGYSGALDALTYIRDNREQYNGTQVYREFLAFMQEGVRLFSTVEED
jgi:hypothetical protein